MGIADNTSWVQAIEDAIAAMHQVYADRGWYDSHELISWLNDHSKVVLNEIIDSYRFKKDGTPAQDPVLSATRQIAKFLADHRDQVQVRKHISHRNVIETEPPRPEGDSVVAVWQIPSNAAAADSDGPCNGPSGGIEADEPRIAAGLIQDRGHGPETQGTRNTVHNCISAVRRSLRTKAAHHARIAAARIGSSQIRIIRLPWNEWPWRRN